jgi:undecaprenyl-diphosphatase
MFLNQLNDHTKRVYKIIFGVCILMFIFFVWEVLESEIYRVDSWVYGLMTSFRNGFLTRIMIDISFIGEQIAICLLFVLVTILIYKNQFKQAISALCATILATGITYLLKMLIARPRPYLLGRLVTENDFSFPSGHSTTAFTVFGILFVMAHRSAWLRHNFGKIGYMTVQSLLALIPVSVAISRLYLGVHYFSDVLAGAIIGLIFCYGFMVVTREKSI